MVRLKWLAALAAAFALCAPASAQKIWGLPPSGPLAGTEQIPATSGAGCATQTLPCKMVSVTPSQLASYLTPGFQPADADLSAIAALSTTPFGRSLLTLTDAPTARSVLGIAIGSNVEAWDADLDGLAAATTSNAIYYRASPGSWLAVALGPNFSFANGNLTIPGLPITVTGDASGATTSASGSLALTLATVNSSPGSYGGPLSISTFTTNAKGQVTASGAVPLGTVPIGQGGTGATTATGAVAAIGAQPSSPILSAVAAQVLNADTCVYWTGASSAATYACPTFGRKLVGSATGAAAAATIGTSYVLARSTVAQSVTNTTSETTLATITIPAGAIGANGFVEVNTLWSNTASANSKSMSLRLNGSQLALAVNSSATIPGYRTIWAFNNVNSQGSQVGNAGAGSGSSGFSLYRTSVDTSAATTLTITGLLATSSETLTLESYIVRIIYGQ